MSRVEIRAIEGLEQEFEFLNNRKQNIVFEIENAKKLATAELDSQIAELENLKQVEIAKVEQIFAEKKSKFDNLLEQVSHAVEIEDEIQEQHYENLGE